MTKKKDMIRTVKRSREYKQEDNSTAARKVLAKAGQHNCKFCPPWEHENKVTRKPKHGSKKPKYKNKRQFTVNILKIGQTYIHIEYKWKVKILFIGEKRAFCYKYGDDIESSWEISLLQNQSEFKLES